LIEDLKSKLDFDFQSRSKVEINFIAILEGVRNCRRYTNLGIQILNI